jgi:hypothetical protein
MAVAANNWRFTRQPPRERVTSDQMMQKKFGRRTAVRRQSGNRDLQSTGNRGEHLTRFVNAR